jgi:adenosine deaminase
MCIVYMIYIFFIIWVVLTQFHDVSNNINKKIVKSKWDSWNMELDINKNIYKKIYIKNAQESFNAYCDALYNEPEQESMKEKAKQIFYTNFNSLENDPSIILMDEDIDKIIETLPVGMDIVEHARNVWLIKNSE